MAKSLERVAQRTCPLCEAACGLDIHVQDERVVKIRGDRKHVMSQGFVCPKGVSLSKLHDDPDRLRQPLIKRDGRHVEASWDEAYAEIERRLLPLMDEFGRNAVGAYLGNPNSHNLAGSLYMRPVLKALGTRNIYSASTVDQMPRHISAGLVFGSPTAMAIPDLDRTHLLVLLGTNPYESGGSLCTAPDFPGRMRAIQERGGRVIVIDPRRTRTSRAADEHIFVRPGSDALLLTAMLQVLFADGLANPAHLSHLVTGLEEVATAVAPFSPERVTAQCGVPAERIRTLAHQLAQSESAAIHGRIGIHTGPFGTLCSWAADALSLLTGNLDREGGTMFTRPPHSRSNRRAGGRGFGTGRWTSRVRKLPESMGELPVSTLSDEILTPGPDQIRALITIAGNPVLSTPDSGRLDQALSQLDFMLSVDIYCNETTRHADVILPPPSPLERSHYDISFTAFSVRNYAHYSQPVFDPQGPGEDEILAKLALMVGGQGAAANPDILGERLIRELLDGHVADEQSPVFGRQVDDLLSELNERSRLDALLDVMLRMGPYGDGFGANPDGLSIKKLEEHPHGIDFGPLKPQMPNLLSTPSARIELAPAAILADFDRLDATLNGGDDEGLLLVGRRDVRSNNSWLHNIESLVSGKDRCRLHMHPLDAAKHGIQNEQEIGLASQAGRINVGVELTEDVMPGVVSLPHGWGHDMARARLSVARSHAGVNSNVLTDRHAMDPVSGNAVLNGIPVTIDPGSTHGSS